MKLSHEKLLYAAAICLLILWSVDHFFNGTALLLPLLIIFFLAAGVLIWSSMSLIVEPLKKLEKTSVWKKLSYREQLGITMLMLFALGTMAYMGVRVFIAGPLVVLLVTLSVLLYSKNR